MQTSSKQTTRGGTTPNQHIEPVSAAVNEQNHLTLGGIDVVDLVAEFGSPLWVMCEDTIRQSAEAVLAGLEDYPHAVPSYAGKAFMCLAIAALVKQLGFGIDVVSEGELVTALEAGFSPDRIFLHGNNKAAAELLLAVKNPGIKIVVDSGSELNDIINLAREHKCRVPVLFRVIPGIDLDTHEHIKTGHDTSKFGIPLDELDSRVKEALANPEQIQLLGLHAHIGSQAMDLEPYLEFVEIMADLYQGIEKQFAYTMPHLDLGGGIGIAYTAEDKPLSMSAWSKALSDRVKQAFSKRSLPLPELSLEPGRSIVGTAGVTIYTVGYVKELHSAGKNYLPVDGGMADNPRPITYQAKYTSVVANRVAAAPGNQKDWSIVGRYCESGDIIVEEVCLDAKRGDLIAVYATGAYNYSMSSNYNRTPRPACVLVKNGRAEVILARETCTDLLRQDRLPSWLK